MRRALCTFLALCVLPSITLAQPGEPIAQPGTQPQTPKILIKGVEYKKLATRSETEKRILDLLAPTRIKWSTWEVVGPFDFFGVGDLKRAFPPEDELPAMTAGGTGPDLSKAVKGIAGADLRWTKVESSFNDKLDFLPHTGKAGERRSSAYAHISATVDHDLSVNITTGSDDGLRLWLNARLLVDADVMRSLDPESDQVRLDLKKGLNHILIKVSQGGGGFEFQATPPPLLDELTAQTLAYHLDADFPPTPEAEFYRNFPMLLPPDVVLECGGLDLMPDGRLIASTRRGDIYIIDGAYAQPPAACTFTKFASGLHEPLGLSVRLEKNAAGKQETAVYVVQRGELTRMVDSNNDNVADSFQSFCNGWGVSGNYHEFAFGPKFDHHGNAWVTLNVGFCDSLGKSTVPWRGWALRISPDGSMTPVCGGLRSPNGIGFWRDGQAFYADNQGDWIATNRLTPLLEGSFQGHPSGLHWRADYKPEMETLGTRPPMVPAAIWIPYGKMGQSVADFLYAPQSDEEAKRLLVPPPFAAFGPFAGQAFVGDQTLCMVHRVTLEKIDGVYQGAVYPFRSSLQCGVNRLVFGKDGSLIVGQTDRGWGSIGRARYGIERITFPKVFPFEIREVRIQPDGFTVQFTQPVDSASATNLASWTCQSYTYEYHATYGSAEMDSKKSAITMAQLISPDTVRIHLDTVRSGGMGFVHELSATGVKSEKNAALLHDIAYYTVQRLPTQDR